MPKGTGVYLITNILDGKRYVGSAASMSVENRMSQHCRSLEEGSHYNQYFQRAWDKYGKESFIFSIAIECLPEECLYWEQIYIDFFKAADRRYGYNLSPTAGSTLGFKFNDEQLAHHRSIRASECYRTKMKEVCRRKYESPEYLARHREMCQDPVTRAKKSAAGKVDWAKNKEMRLEMHREIHSRPEVNAKISAAQRGRPKSPEHCARIKAAKANVGIETRLKMSESARVRGERCRRERKETILKILREKRHAKADKSSTPRISAQQ